MNERNGFSVAGIPFIGLCLVLAGLGAALVVSAIHAHPDAPPVAQLLAGVILLAAAAMLFNEAIRLLEARCSTWRT